MDWLDFTQILLMLGACYACYMWGRTGGIEDAIVTLLDKKIITEQDLEKLEE